MISGETVGIRPLDITNGVATAVWEVTNANPSEIDSLKAAVLVAYQGPIASGIMYVATSLAPIRASSVMSSTAPIPGFGDRSSTDLVTFTPECSAPADLTAPLLTGANTVYQGQTLPVTVTLRNIGAGPAGGFSAVVSLFSSSAMTTVLSSAAACAFESLAAAASATCQRDLPIPAGLTPGTYYAGIVVDGANSVPEVDKTNNKASYAVAVQLRPVSAPQPAAIAPASGSGYAQTFAATFLTQKPNGGEPDAVYFLAAPTITAVNACLIEYTPISGTFRLLANDGATWSASMTTGGTDLQNSQCTVHGTSSGSINMLSDTLQRNLVNYAVTFKSGYGGSKNLYLLAMNTALGLNSGWVTIGAWDVPSAGAVVSLQPLNGGATSGTFTSTFHHTGGANAHYLGYTLFLPTPNVVNYTAQGTCLVEYNRISKGVRLIDNAGTGWLGGAPISSTAQSLSNNQCTIQVSAMTATIDGNTMIVTIPVTFKSSIGPVLGTFLQALDVNGNWTGMTQFGNWGVPGAQQTRVGPAFAGIGIQAGATLNSRKLTTYIAHPAGAAGLSMVTDARRVRHKRDEDLSGRLYPRPRH